jgi:hypothetical protein
LADDNVRMIALLDRATSGGGNRHQLARQAEWRLAALPGKCARRIPDDLSHHVSPGQVDKVRQSLPENIRGLWPEEGELAGGYNPNG